MNEKGSKILIFYEEFTEYKQKNRKGKMVYEYSYYGSGKICYNSYKY